jgi:hypothetical protein
MSDDTPLLSLPLLLPAQAQKHVTHNEALRLLDLLVHLAVIDRIRTAPPAQPAEGDRHIVAAPATGLWEGQEGKVAAFWGGTWAFLTPRAGWLARVLSESTTLAHDGTAWVAAQIPPETLPRLGIATTADAVNRLSLSSPASLFDHAGAGHQIKVNKATPPDTASLLFQTAYSGRAELGLTGNDSLAIKVSGNGSTFATALTADPASGSVTLPEGLTATPLVLRDPADPAKRAQIDIAPLSAGTQRNFTLPNISTELAGLSGTQTFGGNKTFSGTFTVSAVTASIGTSTSNTTYSLASGATASGNSKTVNIGTSGAAGSTTTLTLGPALATATGSTTIHGTTLTLGPTLAQFDMGAASARAALLGVGGATGDSTNRLAVASTAVLFSHAGAGMEATLNKATPADAAQISLKTGFSTRAQFGLIGNDDLSLSVSANGTAFHPVFLAEAATGRLTLSQPVILHGLVTDPASPSEGMIWHNGTTDQLRAHVGGLTHRLDGQQDIPSLTPPSGELVLTTTGAGGGTLGTLAGAAGRIDLFPFMPRADVMLDRLTINCTTAVAGALARILIYGSDANGRPDALLLETADLDLSTIGVKAATVALSLRQGRTVWLGIRHSSTATLSTWPVAATPDVNGGTLPVTAARKVLRRTIAWGSSAPSPWGFTSAEINSAAATAIWLRVL